MPWNSASPQLFTFLAGACAFFNVAMLGVISIPALRRFCREPNASDSPELERLHAGKCGTPTMGGLFLFAGVFAAWLLFTDWRHPLVIGALAVSVALCLLGLFDDVRKIRSGKKGLRPRTKLAAQVSIATVAAAWLIADQGVATSPTLHIPLAAEPIAVSLTLFVPLAVLVIVGTSNAVNLTDGLDGLATGCSAASFAVFVLPMFLGYSLWDAQISVLAGAMCGGLLAFLLFNKNPARVFLGDTGSLAIGGLLGYSAVAAGMECLLLLAGAVFVAEALSVILQVGSFKLRGKRIFLCAPLHHHFQFLGWSEVRIVRRFWLVSVICATLAMAAALAEGRTGEQGHDSAPPLTQSTSDVDLANTLAESN